MLKTGIVRKPGKNFADGLTEANLGAPIFELALSQHTNYCEVLKKHGISLTVLEADLNYPDGNFVEDPAIVTEKCAIITRPGADTRKGEVVKIKEALSKFYTVFEEIKAPGTVEGGDVFRAENHFFIGLSNRTNKEGAQQLSDILAKYGFTSSHIPVKGAMHLKSGAAYIGNNNLVIDSVYKDQPEFQKYNLTILDPKESYATDCLYVNNHLIIADGYPKFKKQVLDLGYEITALNMSEFKKMDGALTCLSLLF